MSLTEKKYSELSFLTKQESESIFEALDCEISDQLKNYPVVFPFTTYSVLKRKLPDGKVFVSIYKDSIYSNLPYGKQENKFYKEYLTEE